VRAALSFAGWTVFVWLTRVRNAAGDDTLSTAGRTVAILFAGAIVALALAAGIALVRGRPRWSPGAVALVRILAAMTVLTWAIRVPFLVVHDHSAAFVLVHAGLAVISIALAVLAVRESAAGTRVRSPARA
jgi:hypothetical protein